MTQQAKPRRGGRRDGLFQRNNFWWIDFTDADGKRHRQKAAPSYEVAKLVLRDKLNKIAKGEVTGTREEDIRMATFANKVWWPTLRLAPEWAARVRQMLDSAILPHFGAFKLSQVRKEMIEAWAAQRRAAISPSALNKELWVVKNVMKYAVEGNYLKTNPAQGVKRARVTRGRIRYLEDWERDQLLHGADVTVKSSDGRTWTIRREPNPTLRLYILVALQTGARRSELIRLTWACIDMKQRTITFRDTKNGSDRTIGLTETLYATLAALPRPLKAATPVLPRIEPRVLTRSFARLVQGLDLKDLKFHDLRHDAASRMAMAGVPIRTIAEVLGHRDLAMTLRYAHLSPHHLREAMRALDPQPLPSGTLQAPSR